MLKAAENPLALAARAVTFGAAVSLPPVAAVWLWQARPGLAPVGWVIVIASAFLELLYFITLSAAYRRGELSVVYPVARGTAPLLAVVVGLLILGERLRLTGLAAIACLLVGIWAVRRPARDSAALAPAIATGVLIAAYSSLDRIGVRLGPPPGCTAGCSGSLSLCCYSSSVASRACHVLSSRMTPAHRLRSVC